MYDSLQDRISEHETWSKILFVDDDPNLLKMIETQLKDEDYQIITAPNGEAGVEKCMAENPHLVFLDIQMPVMDGITALSKIKEKKPDQTVIILSAYDDINTAIQAITQDILNIIRGQRYCVRERPR